NPALFDYSLAIAIPLAFLVAALVGIVLVSIIQGTLAGIIYAIAGVPNSLMWGVATIIACMIPMVGGPIVYAPIGLLLLTQGKTWQGLLVLGVGFGLISQIDNLLRPFFIGAKTNLHPMAIFFSLLGGVLVWGPLGLFLGPMLLTVVLCVFELLGSKDASNDPSFESA
ncbi:MAG TPA: AI-2E family transporter, partial [Fimbriimonadaceae bacterium]|nr:AI-2E family transporter [Fimbriimonadaceae bacterium]